MPDDRGIPTPDELGLPVDGVGPYRALSRPFNAGSTHRSRVRAGLERPISQGFFGFGLRLIGGTVVVIICLFVLAYLL